LRSRDVTGHDHKTRSGWFIVTNPLPRTVAKVLSLKDMREIWFAVPICVTKFSVLGKF